MEIRELAKQSVDYNYTELVCKDAKLDDIDDLKIKEFVINAKQERNFDIELDSKLDFLKKMHLATDSGLNYSSLLLFGKNTAQFVIQSQVRCGRFKGVEPLDFSDMEVIRGTLIEQVEEVMKFVKRNLKLEATFTKELERQEKWEYPLPAIREGITNAIYHRDYSSSANVQVRIFDNRLEIWNPGKLPKELTIEKLKGKHESIPKNRQIADAFFMIKYIEQWGTGVNRIFKLCKEQGLPEPEIEIRENSIILTFLKYQISEGILSEFNERQNYIIDYIKKNNFIQSREIQKRFNVTRDTANRDLNELIAKKIIKRKGIGKKTHYVLM